MNIDELKSKFETGDIPSGKDFSDLIDMCYNTYTTGDTINSYVAGENIIFDTHEPGKTYIINGLDRLEKIPDVNIEQPKNGQIIMLSGDTWINTTPSKQDNHIINTSDVINYLILNSMRNYTLDKIALITNSDTATVSLYVNNDIVPDIDNLIISSNNTILTLTDTYVNLGDNLILKIESHDTNATKIYVTALFTGQ
jgi:hypothetical protein